jgi:carbon storage regulator
MLVLSRKEGEEVVIGTQTRLKVVAICGNRVRLGITAPQDIPIFRGELCHPADSVNGENSPRGRPSGPAPPPSPGAVAPSPGERLPPSQPTPFPEREALTGRAEDIPDVPRAGAPGRLEAAV